MATEDKRDQEEARRRRAARLVTSSAAELQVDERTGKGEPLTLKFSRRR